MVVNTKSHRPYSTISSGRSKFRHVKHLHLISLHVRKTVFIIDLTSGTMLRGYSEVRAVMSII